MDADAVDRAFAILDSVRQPNPRWSSVYDLAAGRVHYRTDQNRALRWLKFSSFDMGCTSPVKILDMNADYDGDLAPVFHGLHRRREHCARQHGLR